MEVTWRNVSLITATGTLTTVGTKLLKEELADDRLAVITLCGPPSTLAKRTQWMAALLDQPSASIGSLDDHAVSLLACMSYTEEDYQVLVIDANITDGSIGWKLLGGLSAMSSLVLWCTNDSKNEPNLVTLPPFQSFFHTISKEFAVVEIYELLPKFFTVDFTPGRALVREENIQHTSLKQSLHTGTSLDGMLQLKNLRVVDAQAIQAETHQLDFFAPHVSVTNLFSSELSGELLHFMLLHFMQDVQSTDVPDLGCAWDEFVEQKCSAVAEDAIATYVDCIDGAVRESPPMELQDFSKLHDEIWRLSMDVYHEGAKFKSTRRRTVRNRLKADIRTKYEDARGVLWRNSRDYCQQVRESVWAEITAPFSSESNSTSFSAILHAIQDFDKQYTAKARGPEKEAVLREFYQQEAIHVFQRLESIVKDQMSETHLKELREQLENDFDAKKEALVEHFKQEESQLRMCMAREIEMMQKLHLAKSSRVKIDENEMKRLREELSEARRLNTELESRSIVLEHAHQDAENQKGVLERKVAELEAAVRQEMTSRAELVDTLAETIKAADEKKKALHMKLDELQYEVGEKSFRIQGELKELTQQLRKTTEEKDELQKKLSEFFLKVTALPEAIQQHLFCLDNGDQVHFADALTSFMSE